MESRKKCIYWAQIQEMPIYTRSKRKTTVCGDEKAFDSEDADYTGTPHIDLRTLLGASILILISGRVASDMQGETLSENGV